MFFLGPGLRWAGTFSGILIMSFARHLIGKYVNIPTTHGSTCCVLMVENDIPIASMGLVYLPTLIPWDSTIHGSVNIPFVPWRLLWDSRCKRYRARMSHNEASGRIWKKVTQLTDVLKRVVGWTTNHLHIKNHNDMPLFLLLLQVDIWWILFWGMYILPWWKWVTQAFGIEQHRGER